jgi:succinoglycan biosynthesis protein ExoH
MTDAEFRISILRFVMIVGIVVLHVAPYVPIAQTGAGWFDAIKAFFQSAVFRCSVPVLTTISGYLLFRSGLDRRFGTLVSKKLKTLGVPFLVFNLPLVAAAFVLQTVSGLSISYQLVPFDSMTIMNAAFGLTAAPINYPLNFLRDLLAVSLLAPVLGWFIRRAMLPGFVFVMVVFLTNLDGYLVLRTEMLVMFYLGGVAAVQKWDLYALDRYAAPCLILFLVACALIVYFRIANTTCFRLVSPLLIWPAASLLHTGRLGNWLARMSRFSFFIFLAHSVVLIASWSVYEKISDQLSYEVYWLVTPFLAVALLVGVQTHGSKRFPRLFRFILGSRTGPIGRAPRRQSVCGPVIIPEPSSPGSDPCLSEPVRIAWIMPRAGRADDAGRQ